MKAKEIQELIDFIAKSGLDEVNIETESFKIAVKRNHLSSNTEQVAMPSQSIPVVPQVINQNPVQTTPNQVVNSNTATPQSDQASTASDKELAQVKFSYDWYILQIA